jgi:transcriptional regulator with XRE-family HTH domain
MTCPEGCDRELQNEPVMELAAQLEHSAELSPLATARVHRKLTKEQAARRAGLTVDQVEWLEEGRVYRFPSADDALLALLVYSTALGIDSAEARSLAGLPVPFRARYPLGRVLGIVSVAALLAVVLATLVPGLDVGRSAKGRASAALVPPWKISVDVLNGSGGMACTRRLADRIGALGYRIQHVAHAKRLDYRQTAVYFEPQGDRIADRLGGALRVPTKPLPGGTNPHRLVVIAASDC